MTVTLHCKPYVKKWLEKKYGSPVKLNRRSTFKATFLSSLEKNFYPSRSYNKAIYSASVEVSLHAHQITQYGQSIQPALSAHINFLIEESIKNELFVFVQAHLLNGSSISAAITKYIMLQEFGDEEITYKGCSSIYYRRVSEYKKILSSSESIQSHVQ